MKKIYLWSIILVLFACQETTEEKKNVKSAFDKNAGMHISTETGLRWIENYNKKSGNARDEQEAFKVSNSNLRAMIASSSQITFHHAIDDMGKYHIIAVPFNESLKLWEQTPNRTIIDANTNSEIDIHDAKRWTKKYKSLNPEKIQYHFFEVNMLNEILQSDEFEIANGIDDEQVPQLLLIVRNNSDHAGRVNTYLAIFSGVNRCPPYCPE